MNDPTPSRKVPEAAPPRMPQSANPSDYVPMTDGTGPWAALEALLKHPQRVLYQLHKGDGERILGSFLFVLVPCLLAYGLIIGSFSGGDQLWAAPVKVLLGTLFSALICLPSLYIFACLDGTEARFSEVVGLLLGAVTLSSVLLIGFAPVAWVFAQSTNSVAFMGGLHLAFWIIGTWFGLKLLCRGLRQTNPDGSRNLGVWASIFILVCLQMTTTLRPLLGAATTFLPYEKKFFLAYWLDCLK